LRKQRYRIAQEKIMRLYASMHTDGHANHVSTDLVIWAWLKYYYALYSNNRHHHREMLQWLGRGR
jgi:hypothetical protein